MQPPGRKGVGRIVGTPSTGTSNNFVDAANRKGRQAGSEDLGSILWATPSCMSYKRQVMGTCWKDPVDWAHAVLGAAAYAVALNQLRTSEQYVESCRGRSCQVNCGSSPWPRIDCEQMRQNPSAKCTAGDGRRTGWWGLQMLCLLTGMHGTEGRLQEHPGSAYYKSWAPRV